MVRRAVALPTSSNSATNTATTTPATKDDGSSMSTADLRKQMLEDRQKQIDFALERQERAAILQEEVETAAANGKLLDSDMLYKQRKLIENIGKDDPSTKRASSIYSTLILPQEVNHHYKRKFFLFILLVLVLIVLSMTVKPSSSVSSSNSGGTNGGNKGTNAPFKSANIALKATAGGFFVVGWLIAFSRIRSRYSREKDPHGNFMDKEESLEKREHRGGFFNPGTVAGERGE